MCAHAKVSLIGLYGKSLKVREIFLPLVTACKRDTSTSTSTIGTATEPELTIAHQIMYWHWVLGWKKPLVHMDIESL